MRQVQRFSSYLLAVLLYLIPVQTGSTNGPSDDDALYLTPYIESGRIKEAQKLSKVSLMLEGVESFSGYLTVNKTYNSNLFFWLVKSQSRQRAESPLVVWLPGGPGVTSIYGNFDDVGPFFVRERRNRKRDDKNRATGTSHEVQRGKTKSHKKQESVDKRTSMKPSPVNILQAKSQRKTWHEDFELVRRKYTWTRKYNVVFFDVPVGTGYSFTENDSGYAKDVADVTRDLLKALAQFYQLFPTFQRNKLYMLGQCFGGRFALDVAEKLYELNRTTEFSGNWRQALIPVPSGFISWGGTGIAFDPASMTRTGSFLYNVGLIDQQRLQEFVLQEDEQRAQIAAGDYVKAWALLKEELHRITELTGLNHTLDFTRESVGDDPNTTTFKFFNRTDVKKIVHVGNHTLNTRHQVISHMIAEMKRPMKIQFEKLLSAKLFPIICFNGQLDATASYTMELKFFNSLEWPHAKDYYSAKRCLFKVGNRTVAYYKKAGSLTEVMVRNTGHFLAKSQPRWMFELIDAFIENTSALKCP